MIRTVVMRKPLIVWTSSHVWVVKASELQSLTGVKRAVVGKGIIPRGVLNVQCGRGKTVGDV